MKLFMEALWSATGREVTGVYHGMPFEGFITDVRAMYGTDLQVTVVDSDDEMYLIDGTTMYDGGNGIYENLHVYM